MGTPTNEQAARRRPKRGATILDIAHRLGLSAMTVSRALTGNPEVSETTRRKVLRCAEAIGYRPNRWARSLVTRKSSIIGVVIPDISHSFFAEITYGVEEVLEKAGYDILLCHSRGSVEKERAEIDMLIDSRVDGLIIASEQPESSPSPFQALIDRHIPFVVVDRFFPKLRFTSVRVDDLAVGRIATEHLLALGHRSIAHIGGPRLSPASLRRRGYLAALKAAGIRVDRSCMAPGNFDIPSGRGALQRLLPLDPRPTAVFTANDPMAIGAVYACREAGLRVPDDISIVGASVSHHHRLAAHGSGQSRGRVAAPGDGGAARGQARGQGVRAEAAGPPVDGPSCRAWQEPVAALDADESPLRVNARARQPDGERIECELWQDPDGAGSAGSAISVEGDVLIGT